MPIKLLTINLGVLEEPEGIGGYKNHKNLLLHPYVMQLDENAVAIKVPYTGGLPYTEELLSIRQKMGYLVAKKFAESFKHWVCNITIDCLKSNKKIGIWGLFVEHEGRLLRLGLSNLGYPIRATHDGVFGLYSDEENGKIVKDVKIEAILREK